MSDLPPPPPPPPGFSGAASPGLSVGEALSRGWASFTKRWVDFLIIAVIVGVISGFFAWALVRDDFTAWRWGLYALISIVLAVFASLWQTKVALAATDGDTRPFGQLVSEANHKLGQYIVWTLLAGLIIFVGFLLCFFPGLVAAFFLMFVPFLAIEMHRQGNPIGDSFSAVKEQAGNLLLLFLAFLGIGIVAGLISNVLGLIPLIGSIAGAIIQFVLFGFVLCTLAAVYRASAIGRAQKA